MSRPVWLKPLSFGDPRTEAGTAPTRRATGRAGANAVLADRYGLIAVALVFAVVAGLAIGAIGLFAPLTAIQTRPVSLDPLPLPGYAVRTVLRMLAAMVASLFFTLTYGTWAAKSRRAGVVLIPLLDILQSVPVLGYLSFTVTFSCSSFRTAC